MSYKALIDTDMLIDNNGYVRHRKGNKYVHRVIVEIVLNRQLLKPECIHHIDYNRKNNSPTNLVVCPNQSYHMLLHARQRVIELGGVPDLDKYCSHHKCLHVRSEFSTSPSKYDGLHNICKTGTNQIRRERGYKTTWTWKARMNQQARRAVKLNKASKLCRI